MTSVNERLKAGFIQFDVQLGKVDANVETAISGIDTLVKKGADLAVLPEMWSCGFDNFRLKTHARRTAEILERLSESASRNKVVVAGSLPESADGKIYNSLYIIDRDGTVVGKYRKVHLFTLNLEHKFFGAGDRNVICDTSIGPIGMMVCYDLRFPEFCRSLALRGAHIVVVCAQWPAIRVRHWNILVQARAVENQLFMIAANRCGNDSDLEYGGHSQIVSPGGEILTAADKIPCTDCVAVDLREIDSFRKQIPCLEERIPDAYSC
jgi:omega-amidase